MHESISTVLLSELASNIAENFRIVVQSNIFVKMNLFGISEILILNFVKFLQITQKILMKIFSRVENFDQ